MLRMESPPRSKKLSRTPTRLIPSCSAQMAASRVCVSPSGATNALVSNAASGGGGSRLRAVFPAEFKGMESRLISAWGIMYSGTISRSAVFISLTSGELPGAGTMYPTRRWTPGTSSRTIAAALATSGNVDNAFSTSPSSIRNPLILTWSSLRPRNSSCISLVQRTTSPVRYMRSPVAHGHATKRSAVNRGASS